MRNAANGEFDPEEFDATECTHEMRSWFSSVAQPKQIASGKHSEDFDINEDFFDVDGELDDVKFQEWSNCLQNQFADSPEFGSLPEDGCGFVDCLLQYSVNYLNVTPATMSVVDLNEILFDIIPRKVMAEPEDAAGIIAEFNAFFRFIQREHALAGAKKLADALNDKAVTRLTKMLDDDSNFGMAKAFFAKGKAAGYDMTSQDQLNQFAMAYNSSLGQPTVDAGPGDLVTSNDEEYVSTIRRQSPRIGRNDPCPCGSGKKYKKCCQRSDE
jgi:hypothetical protein